MRLAPPRCSPGFLLLGFLVVAVAATKPLQAARAADPPVPPPETIDELSAKVAAGDCGEAVLQETRKLEKAYPRSPDPLVLQANCRMRVARTTERVFDDLAYERLRLLHGDAMGRETLAAAYRTAVTLDPKQTNEALALFRKALDLAPARADLVVGNIAALANTGRAADAVRLLGERKGALDSVAQQDVARTATDLLALGDDAAAAALAGALESAFPGSDAALRAGGLVALAQSDIDGAARRLAALAALHPLEAAPAADAARLLLFGRRWNDAISTLVTHAARSDEMLFWLGIARSRVSPPSAVPLFRELLDRTKDKNDTDTERLRNAAQHYVKALADPRRPNVAMRIRAANHFLRAGLPIAAVAELDDAIAQEPDSIEAHKRLADVYVGQELPGLAADALGQAVALAQKAPQDSPYPPAELLALRGRALFAAKKDRQAADAFAAARAAGQPLPYEEALVFLALRDGVRAKALLEEAVAAGGENAVRAAARLERM